MRRMSLETAPMRAGLVAVFLFSSLAQAVTPVGSSVVYQGRLDDGGAPANGTYDFEFRLFDAATLGAQVGAFDTQSNVSVTDGLFTVTLSFGANVFTADARWMDIRVRPGASGGAHTILSPRQRVQPAPVAQVALKSLADVSWTLSGDDLENNNVGDVGINVSSPAAKLHVRAEGTTQFQPPNVLRLTGVYPGTLGDITAFLDLKGTQIHAVENNVFKTLALQPDGGSVGIGLTSTSDTKLHVSRSVAGVYNSDLSFEDVMIEDAGNAWLGLYSDNVGNVGSGITFGEKVPFAGGGDNLLKWGIYARTTDNVGDLVVTFGNDPNPTANEKMLQIDRDGTTKVKVLEILGADMAERFPTTDSVEPGHVVMIDANTTGQLCLARGAYNTRVAGVVSGAGNLPVGAILGNLKGHDDGPPVALTGRVWTMCDAGENAIEPGDLLTSSDTPGHAMKAVDRERRQGAVIGKAMSRLAAGERGLVLVLIQAQ